MVYEVVVEKLKFRGNNNLTLSSSKNFSIPVSKHAPSSTIPRSFEKQQEHGGGPTRTLSLYGSMAQPIILSDEEDQNSFVTPLQCPYKKPRTGPDPIIPTVLVLDDDPTPQKPGVATSVSSTPSFVAETPMSDVAIVKCTMGSSVDAQFRVSNSDKNLSG